MDRAPSSSWPKVCERCDCIDLAFGVCCACGWRSPQALAGDAKLRKSGVAKVRQKAEYGMKVKPAYIVETHGGAIVRSEFKCPECRGRGWLHKVYDGCLLCFGHGTISGVRLTRYRQHGKK